MPQNVHEYKKAAREFDSIFFPKKKLNLKGATLGQVKLRMQKYSAKCLNLTVNYTKDSLFSDEKTIVSQAIYRPTIVESKNELSLILQRDCVKGCGSQQMPKGGMWISISEVFLDSKGVLTGYSAAPSNTPTGNLLEDSIGWLEGTSTLCPALK